MLRNLPNNKVAFNVSKPWGLQGHAKQVLVRESVNLLLGCSPTKTRNPQQHPPCEVYQV